jgi:hypothetical protein
MERNAVPSCSKPPPHRGCRGSPIIGAGPLLHLSLNRWFTRSVHSFGVKDPRGLGRYMACVRDEAGGRSPLLERTQPADWSREAAAPGQFGAVRGRTRSARFGVVPANSVAPAG